VATTLCDHGAQVRLLKAFLVAFLSVLPGWLCLQFIALKGTVLYDGYVLTSTQPLPAAASPDPSRCG